MLLRTLSRTLIVLAAALTAGCVLYGAPEDIKTCEQVVCGANATCGGEEAACFCDAGYSGNPYDGCVATQPEVDASCSASCGQFAYCSEEECYCELDHVPVCGENAGCFPEARLCDGNEDCPNGADEAPAACSEPIFQEWLLTDRCDDGNDVEWKLFAQDRDWSWPVEGEVFLTGGYLVDMYQTISCFRDEMICFAGVSGDNTWGFNLDGTGECDACCAPCGSSDLLDLGYLDCNG